MCRFDTPDGKQILPRTYDGTRWAWKGVLAAQPAAPVLLTEGEKAADAAAALFPGCVATTAPNGAKAAKKADLSTLKGRTVYIWPDNDEQGAAYAECVADLAHEASAASVKVLQLNKLPEQLPPKDDAAV